jgi:hypothetical protein
VLASAIDNIATQLSGFMTLSQKIRASTLVSELINGSPAPLLYELPHIRDRNSKSVYNLVRSLLTLWHTGFGKVMLWAPFLRRRYRTSEKIQ